MEGECPHEPQLQELAHRRAKTSAVSDDLAAIPIINCSMVLLDSFIGITLRFITDGARGGRLTQTHLESLNEAL